VELRGDGLRAEGNRCVDPGDQFKDAPKVIRQVPETPFEAPHRRGQSERSSQSLVTPAEHAKRSCRGRFDCQERTAEAAAEGQ
jgi:hypothetical protein